MAALRADQWRRSRALQHARGRERALVAEVAGRRTQTRALAEQLARAAQQVSLDSLKTFTRHSKCLSCGWRSRALAEQLSRVAQQVSLDSLQTLNRHPKRWSMQLSCRGASCQ